MTPTVHLRTIFQKHTEDYSMSVQELREMIETQQAEFQAMREAYQADLAEARQGAQGLQLAEDPQQSRDQFTCYPSSDLLVHFASPLVHSSGGQFRHPESKSHSGFH